MTLARAITMWVLLAVAAFALMLVGFSGWLLDTTGGARWAISLASSQIPHGSLTVEGIEGTLASPLSLRGVRLLTDTLDVRAARVALRWELPGLLHHSLDIRTLSVDSLILRQRVAPPPPGPTTLTGLKLPLTVRVGEARVTHFESWGYHDSVGTRLAEAILGADMTGDQLRLTRLAVSDRAFSFEAKGGVRTSGDWPLGLDVSWSLLAPAVSGLKPLGRMEGAGRIDGSAVAPHLDQRLVTPVSAHLDARAELDRRDLARPPRHFAASLEVAPLDPARFADGVPPMKVGGELSAEGTLERFRARLRSTVRSDSLGDFDLAASMARAPGQLQVDSLRLTLPGRATRFVLRGVVNGLGDTLRIDSLRFDLTADWRAVAWPLRGDTLVSSAAGHAHVAGRPAGFTYELAGDLAAARLDLGSWQANGTGDTTRITIAALRGTLLGGDVEAHGVVTRSPLPGWDLDVAAEHLDLARVAPDWPGVVTVALHTTGSLRDSVPEFEATLRHLDGTLRGRTLAGHGELGMHEGVLHAHELLLGWGDGRITLDGRAGDTWDLAGRLRVPSLAEYQPEASGRVVAEFALSGPRAEPRLTLSAHGDSLGWLTDQVGALDLKLTAEPRPGAPLSIALEARRVFAGGLPLERVTLAADGTTADHHLAASATTERESLWVDARGGLAHDTWRGEITRLEARTMDAGRWGLVAPAPLVVSPRAGSLRALALRSEAGRLETHADWDSLGRWEASARLSHLPLSLLDPWMPEGARLEGAIEGSLDARSASARGPLTAELQLTQGPSRLMYRVTRARSDTLAIGGGRLVGRLDHTGADAVLDLKLIGEDFLRGHVSLPGFDALAPDTLHQPLAGRIEARLGDLGVLGPFVPGLSDPRGSLSANFELSGTTRAPDVRGEAHLREAQAQLQAVGITVREVTLDATRESGSKLALSGSMRSGNGALGVTGDIDLAARGGPRVALALKGKDFQALDTREARVTITPDLTLAMHGDRVDLGGQLEIPFARIQVNGALAQLPTPPSPDVVFVGPAPDSVPKGPQVHTRVRVILGDDVEIRVPGFRGKPRGSLLAIDEPGTVTRGTGELTLSEGTYKAYGQDLVIEKGRLVFGGGPLSDPGVDIRASRTASDHTVAGLQISGTAERPVLTVFSQPTMPDADAVSYIMFGKPLDATSKEGGIAKQAASQLGVQGSDLLAKSLASKVGIQDASVESSGSMQDASLFLGTYVSPRLYLSYGMGLFKPGNTVRMRYSVSRRWAVQAESGQSQSGLIQYSGEH